MAEKNVNEMSREARAMYAKAAEAAMRDNLDYAITLFNQLLEREPAFFECRKALREAQFKKAGTGGRGLFKKLMSGAGSSPQVTKAHMTLRGNPAGALAIAEGILNSDPNSPPPTGLWWRRPTPWNCPAPPSCPTRRWPKIRPRTKN